jgi:MFS family permease/1-acyl-sn-glycerol-3-phosphate acyltransferase
MAQPFKPYETLANRTFVGLIVAQFFAAFNDQCIHAAAMFYAINFVGKSSVQGILSEKTAISLMPILFYAPWAIFCTLAGYLADRYSKRSTLVFWKMAEVLITLIALAGFWIGVHHQNPIGPWIVLSTVFLMGMHSAFFVPAKYGVMPEILPHSLLSKGNGVLESTSFLAIIMGTVCGGILSDERVFKGQEHFIGLILVGLAVIGALASLVIHKMPAAHPQRPFPTNLYKPLWVNLRTLVKSKPLVLSVLGIAFFTFMVAFMRQTMYMHGETRNPRWSEFEISLVVGTVALGIGIGSPLAGWLSGGKVELGLVPLGATGMFVATAVAAFVIDSQAGLVICLVALGFCVGFYFVPLYSLLQHRAPKSSKGDLIATSNFINVVGAILASLLFFLLVSAAHWLAFTPRIEQRDICRGQLVELRREGNELRGYRIHTDDSDVIREFLADPDLPPELHDELHERLRLEEADVDFLELIGRSIQDWQPDASGKNGPTVIISHYRVDREGVPVDHYRIRPAEQPQQPVYNEEGLPFFLFLGASLMTLGIVVLLCRQLPDFFVRSLLWMRSFGRYHVRVYGIQHLPDEGSGLLVTNCRSFQHSMHVLASTDRNVRFLLIEDHHERETPLLRFLAKQTGMTVLQAGKISDAERTQALRAGTDSLRGQHLVALSADGQEFERFLTALQQEKPETIVPVYCGVPEVDPAAKSPGKVRVVFGERLPPTASPEDVRKALHALGVIVKAVKPGATMGEWSHH